MGRPVALVSLLLVLAVVGCGGDESLHTEVVHWSPFNGDGKLESKLQVSELGNGECLGPSITIGAPGYRCKAGRWVLDPCWRNGEGVACVGFPWDDTVSTIRVPSAWFDAHPPHAVARARPWAIELAGGSRCRVLQSSHTTVELRGRPLHVDYDCDDGLVLLRNLTRGRVWTIASARWDKGHYTVQPGADVRRAYVG